MPGPPPNPSARRRNDKDAWRILQPRCETKAPKWPLGVRPNGLTSLWAHLWALPQAEIWHEQNAVRLVSRYALLMLAFENGYISAAEDDDGNSRSVDLTKIPAELRQIEDRLLISPLPRLRARVLIAEKAVEVDTGPGGTVTNIDDYRDLGVG